MGLEIEPRPSFLLPRDPQFADLLDRLAQTRARLQKILSRYDDPRSILPLHIASHEEVAEQKTSPRAIPIVPLVLEKKNAYDGDIKRGVFPPQPKRRRDNIAWLVSPPPVVQKSPVRSRHFSPVRGRSLPDLPPDPRSWEVGCALTSLGVAVGTCALLIYLMYY